ncbi:hypothetical protein SAMN05192534_12453 [Alteribacillus persepolensis]|uniref:Uncharacterized protein n=1 Tax=Alteribacillus persepolensis TaxID=568899 RepID=A0A1G8IK10_9BACI|nr:hypothetical protein [Alteribacillus persepolensis]SDI19244.1 hypothetical protein SAMN05192534_12453 [Alteribacillus persepolensis]
MNTVIMHALSNLDVPVQLQTYSGSENTYVTFFEYNNRPGMEADDEEVQSERYYQVDVWSNGDYTSLVDEVRTAMKSAGFRRRDEREFYEEDTKTFHRALRFVTNTPV